LTPQKTRMTLILGHEYIATKGLIPSALTNKNTQITNAMSWAIQNHNKYLQYTDERKVL
jgi:hypothetical protein